MTLKYGGGPQEDLLQYGLLVRLLTETTSTGQNNNANQMAISDGIGGTSTGTVMSQYAAAVAVSAPITVSGIVATITVASGGTVFKPGQYLTFSSATLNGNAITNQYFQVLSSSGTTITVEVLAGSVFSGTGNITPYQPATGLLNTRQSQIQGLENNFTSATLGTLPDDSWQESRGMGSGAVPNSAAALPGGMSTPTTPYSVRRYMVQFALGTFTQDKLLPTKWLASQLAIEITLELPENCIYQPLGYSGNTVQPRYMVGNVALIPEIIEFDDTYDNNFLATLESGGVPIKFATWNYYQFNTQGSSKLQLSITERSRSVKGILAVQRRAQGGFQYDSHACIFDSCTSVALSGKASSMKEFQYRIGGRYFPGQPVELSLSGSGSSNGGAEAYSELSKFLNIVGDARLSTSIVPLNWAVPAMTHNYFNLLPEFDYSFSLTDFHQFGSPQFVRIESAFSPFCGNLPSCMFAAAINFETSNGMEISGLNAEEQADISFLVSWTEAQSSTHQIEVFTYCDRMWVIKVLLILTLAKQLCRSCCLIKYGTCIEMGDNFGLNDNYEYKEFALDSLDADGPFISSAASTDWPRYSVAADGPLENVAAIKVLEAEISFSWDVFNSENNTFTITETVGGPKTITIPVGNYTGGAIATALTTAFVTAGTSATYTVTYSGLRNRLVFTSSTNNSFYFSFGAGYNIPGVQPNSGNKNPRLYIGFPPGDTLSSSVGGVQVITSPNSLLLSGPNYLYLNSTKLGADMDVFLPTGAFNLGGGKAGPQIAKIPVDCNANNLITWKDPDPQKWFKFKSLQSITNFDFYLTLGNTTSQVPLQLNGLGFSLKLGILKTVLTNSSKVLPTAQNGRVANREGPKRIRPAY